jgi:hypothetical protein
MLPMLGQKATLFCPIIKTSTQSLSKKTNTDNLKILSIFKD